MEWYAVELNQNDAKELRYFLKTIGVYYEPSSCYELVHFEIKCDARTIALIDIFLDSLYHSDCHT